MWAEPRGCQQEEGDLRSKWILVMMLMTPARTGDIVETWPQLHPHPCSLTGGCETGWNHHQSWGGHVTYTQSRAACSRAPTPPTDFDFFSFMIDFWRSDWLMGRTVSSNKLRDRQMKGRWREAILMYLLCTGTDRLVPVALCVHKVPHTQQCSITTHLSEVTSWEAICFHGNAAEVNRWVDLYRDVIRAHTGRWVDWPTDRLSRAWGKLTFSFSRISLRICSLCLTLCTDKLSSVTLSQNSCTISCQPCRTSRRFVLDGFNCVCTCVLTGWLMWNLVGILLKIAESRSWGRLVAPMIITWHTGHRQTGGVRSHQY